MMGIPSRSGWRGVWWLVVAVLAVVPAVWLLLANPEVDEVTHASVVATEVPPTREFLTDPPVAVMEEPPDGELSEFLRLIPEPTADGFVVATSLGRWVFELMPPSDGLDRVLSVWKDAAGTYYRHAVYDTGWPRLETSVDGAEWVTVPFPDVVVRLSGAGALGEGLLAMFPIPESSGFRIWLFRGGRWTLVEQDLSGEPYPEPTVQRLSDGRWLVASITPGSLAGLLEELGADCAGVLGARLGPYGWEVVLGDSCGPDGEAGAVFLIGGGADAIVVLTGRDGQVGWQSEPGPAVETSFDRLLDIAFSVEQTEYPVDVWPFLAGLVSVDLLVTADGVAFESLATGLFAGEMPNGVNQPPAIAVTRLGLIAFVPDVAVDAETGWMVRGITVWESPDGRMWTDTGTKLTRVEERSVPDIEAASYGDQVLVRVDEETFLGGYGQEWRSASDTWASYDRTEAGWLRYRYLMDGSSTVGVSADALTWEFFDTGDVPIPEGCSEPTEWTAAAGEVWLSSTRQGQPAAPVACTWRGTFQADVTVPGPAGGTVDVDYPEWWYRSFRSLTPNLAGPIEVLSVGTYPLRPGGEQCAQVPENALRDLGPRDVLISLQVSGNREGGAPWPDEWSAESLSSSRDPVANVCAERPDLDVRWKLFTFQETGIYVLVALGDEVTDATLAETWAILDSFAIVEGSG